MRKLRISIIPILFVVLMTPFFLQAATGQNVPNQGRNVPSENNEIIDPLGIHSVSELVSKLLDIVIKVGSVLAVVFIIYAGFKFVWARGKPTEIEDAKKTFYYVIIGTAIILGAKVIQEIIENTVKDVIG